MNDNQYTVEPGERDPVRPPGLLLVLIAMLALGGLGYAIFPERTAVQSSPTVGGGGPSANTNPAASPTGK